MKCLICKEETYCTFKQICEDCCELLREIIRNHILETENIQFQN